MCSLEEKTDKSALIWGQNSTNRLNPQESCVQNICWSAGEFLLQMILAKHISRHFLFFT